MSIKLPPGMSASKLRFIADYVDECDSLAGQFLASAAERGSEVAQEAISSSMAFVAGKEVQDSLRDWADYIEQAQEIP